MPPSSFVRMDETAVGSEEPGAAVTPPPSRERLRVGLLVDSLMQPAWVVEALRQIIRDGTAEIANCREAAQQRAFRFRTRGGEDVARICGR